MTRTDLANTPAEATPPPTEAGPTAIDPGLLERLAEALEALAKAAPSVDPELKLYTPAEAAELLGKTENWVAEAVKFRRIPCTFVGRSPRFMAKHIRAIAEAGEIDPATRRPKGPTAGRLARA